MKETNEYDIIIIGAGASGLFTGASLPLPPGAKGLILEKQPTAGKKLLLAGSGQCNLTHSGNIKEFVNHYDEQGKSIRSILYHFNNEMLIRFFTENGLPVVEREDGKIFPRSLRGQDVLHFLLTRCNNHGFPCQYSQSVQSLEPLPHGGFRLLCSQADYKAKNVIVATGGCSYPQTGSDGQFFSVLEELALKITPLRPALSPIYLQNYPFKELSGIALQQAVLTVADHQTTGGLLFTHTCLSGPTALHAAAYTKTGDRISINYLGSQGELSFASLLQKSAVANKKTLGGFVYDLLCQLSLQETIPHRLVELLCRRAALNPAQKASQLSGSDLKKLAAFFTNDTHSVSGVGGFSTAMVTKGGLSLTEINKKTMESLRYPGLFFIGEALDVNGDTGGYNLQFAFSSAHLAAETLQKRFTKL